MLDSSSPPDLENFPGTEDETSSIRGQSSLTKSNPFEPCGLLKQADFLMLNSNLKLNQRKFILDYDQKVINSSTIFHFDSPIPLRWWEDSIQINLREVARISRGLKTDKWIQYRNTYPNSIDLSKNDYFSIVFKYNVYKDNVDLMIDKELLEYNNNWIDEVEEMLEKIRKWKIGINECHKIMLRWNFYTYIFNRSRLEARIVQRHKTISRFSNKRKLREFILKLDIDIDKQYLEHILRMYYRMTCYSIKDGHNKNHPKFERFESVMDEFDSRACFDFLFYKYSICKTEYMNANGLRKFFQQEQREEKSLEECNELIIKYEQHIKYLSRKSFYRLLESSELFSLFDPKHLMVSQDMNQPMSHYFIASSHNSYLTGNQLTSSSSYEIYRHILLSGCRCIEIDVWDDSSYDEPVVCHGYTITSKIMLRNVLETINEVAFKKSEYPVIISIENRCHNLENHQKMAQMMKEIFKERLYTGNIGPDESQHPSPEQLKGKILIKGSKSEIETSQLPSKGHTSSPLSCISCVESSNHDHMDNDSRMMNIRTNNQNDQATVVVERIVQKKIPKKRIIGDIESDDDDELEEVFFGPTLLQKRKPRSRMMESKVIVETSATKQEPETVHIEIDKEEDSNDFPDSPMIVTMGASMSIRKKQKIHPEFCELINYFKTRKFKNIEECVSNFKFYEMISRDENSSAQLIRNNRDQYERFCRQNMVRIYPKASRQDSSNYNPLCHWNVGAQLVALNYQTLSKAMIFNYSLFALNGNCGYVLKPEFLPHKPKIATPFASKRLSSLYRPTKTVTELKLQLLCGQFWRIFDFKQIGLRVRLSVYYPGENLKFICKRCETKTITENGFNPIWNETFFIDIDKPELSFLWFTLSNNGSFVGQYMISIEAIQKGFRHVNLYDDKLNQLDMCRLFLYVDYNQVDRHL